jgi:hypothetical protein
VDLKRYLDKVGPILRCGHFHHDLCRHEGGVCGDVSRGASPLLRPLSLRS